MAPSFESWNDYPPGSTGPGAVASRSSRDAAFKSGKPALVNVIGDKTVGHPTLGGNLLGSTGTN